MLLGVIVGVNHQRQGQNRAGNISGQEQLSDGDAGNAGRRQCVDNHVLAGRNQDTLNGAGHGQTGGELSVVALLFHHLDLDGS